MKIETHSNEPIQLLKQSVMTVNLDSIDGPVRVVQITDCHLGEQLGEELVGMNTDVSLDHVLKLISAEQLDASVEPRAKLILATGDLSNHGAETAYQRLLSKLLPLGIPSAWLAGNHDSRDMMLRSVGSSKLPRIIRIGRWAILMLDSAVPGQVAGELGDEELQRLNNMLKVTSDAEHLLICLHHQPVPIGCTWLDEQRLADGDEFFNILAGESRLRGIIWGHVHQEYCGADPRLPGVKLMAAPSTCAQFAPNHNEFSVDSCAPGYRWLDLHDDGRIDSQVSRLQNIDLPVDIASLGYGHSSG